jgi:hypothetical protein
MANKERLVKAWLSDRDLEDLGLGSAKTRQNLRAAGKEFLPYYRFGRSVRYKLEDIMDLIERNRVNPQPE